MTQSFATVSAPLHDWLRSNGIEPNTVKVTITVPTLEAQSRTSNAIRKEFDALMQTPDVRLGVVKNIKAHGMSFEFKAAPQSLLVQ